MATQTRGAAQARSQQQQSAPRNTPPSGGGGPPTNVDSITSAIEKAVDECGIDAIATLPKMQQIVKLSQGIQALKAVMTEEFVKATFKPLENTPLGFLTDKPDGGYPIPVIRDCIIDAFLRGFNPVGNEMNIIAGRFYGAKAGFERLVHEYPGVTELILEPGVPVAFGEKTALVPFIATWRLNGNRMRIACVREEQRGEDGKIVSTGPDLRIPVRVNSQMGPDAVIGKAYRKMYFRIWSRLKGGTFGLLEGDASEATIDTVGTPAPASKPSSKATALKDMAAAHQQKKASTPPPANDAPPSAENDTIDASADVSPEELIAELSLADGGWGSGDPALLATVRSWTPAERVAAFDWASAMNDPTPTDEPLPERPEWTRFERQPGEEG